MRGRELVIVACLLAGSADLADAWAHDPYVSAGAPLALAWALAVRGARSRCGEPPARSLARWRAAAVALAALARVLDVHALAHFGLAAWLVAPVPGRWPLLAAAAGWSPVAGQLAAPVSPFVTNVVRVALSAAALALAARREGRDVARS